jgi:thymidylate kinase
VHGDLTAQLAAYEVIVLEGCDGTGKTTLAAALALRRDYAVIHSGRTPDGTDLTERYQALLAIPGKIILDRSFISELVYGPLDHGQSRLTLPDAADLARRVAARSGVLVHLTGHPDTITARLRSRDGPAAPAADRIRAIIGAYHATFALLDGTAPITTTDTTTPGYPNPPPGSGAADLRLPPVAVLHQDTVRQAAVHARCIPGDLHLNLLLQINAGHLG